MIYQRGSECTTNSGPYSSGKTQSYEEGIKVIIFLEGGGEAPKAGRGIDTFLEAIEML